MVPPDMSLPRLPRAVLIVEDDPLMQERLLGVLRGLGIAQASLSVASSLEHARVMLAREIPELVLLDLGLPDGNGLSLIPELRRQSIVSSTMVISSWSIDDMILQALRLGAVGYLLKERDDLELTVAIRSVLRGGASIDPFIARQVLSALSGAAPQLRDELEPSSVLSSRENQILSLVADGLSNLDIAHQLFISRFTVESHIKHIYRKLEVSSRTAALKQAREQGLIR